jgi:hypothetical protein
MVLVFVLAVVVVLAFALILVPILELVDEMHVVGPPPKGADRE